MSVHVMTEKILKAFEDVSKVPRQSKYEEKIAHWLLQWAKEKGFEGKKDAIGNVLIKVPASSGYENSPTVIIQGHLDMVCEKTPDSNHDFSKDPIKFVYDGDWLTAEKTTLGADNGIAIAMGMVLTDEGNEHPPLELLFTVDEETGLTGAQALEPGFIEGKILLNIDSEDEGVFTIGCAGGKSTTLSIPLEYKEAVSECKGYTLTIGGLKGGHSGVDIKLQRSNSIKFLMRVLKKIGESVQYTVADIKGGSAHNAIPRDAHAKISFLPSEKEKVDKAVAEMLEIFKIEAKNTDPEVFVKLEENGEVFEKVIKEELLNKVIDVVISLPHGVDVMSTDIEGLVQTSNNLATIEIKDGAIEILTSQRSSIISELLALTDKIEGIGRLAGAKVESDGGYPAWQPNMNSALLERCKKVYTEYAGKEPKVEIIHAGLECGIIGSKYEGMDMISFGPTIQFPHCPDERIEIETIGKVWDFMIALMKSFK